MAAAAGADVVPAAAAAAAAAAATTPAGGAAPAASAGAGGAGVGGAAASDFESFRPFNAYIVGAKRSAGGRRNGRLSKWHPADLGAAVVDALLEETGVEGKHVDDCIMGCVMQYGAQSGNLGRGVVLSSRKLPLEVPGTSVDRQCGSSQQALHFASQAVMSGTQDVVVAGGVEVMSLVPIGSAVRDGIEKGRGHPKGAVQEEKWPGVQFSQFTGAEMLAEKHSLSRADLDELAFESHRRAHEATEEGRFKREIVPLTGVDPKTGSPVQHDRDEGIRWPASKEAMAGLKTLADGGKLTAASSSQICDGAAALLIVNERGLAKLGLKPRARIVEMALAGSDPVVMLEGIVPATQNVLRRAGMTLDDIDLAEVNEAFASVPLTWLRVLKGDHAKVNVNGGAMALGHPLGGSGAKLFTTLLHEMERTGKKTGLVTMCEGGGTANATIIELPNAQGEFPAPRARL